MSADEAAGRITRNRGKIEGGVITHPGPGLKVWAAIDCLCNYHNYRYGGKGDKSSKRASKRKGKSFNRR